jgi:hypothetical protein
MSKRRVIQIVMVVLLCFNLGTLFERYIEPTWGSLSKHRTVQANLPIVTETGERISSLFAGVKAPAGYKPRPAQLHQTCTPNSTVGAVSKILSTALVTTVSAQECQGNYMTTDSYSCGFGGDCNGLYYYFAYADGFIASYCDGSMTSGTACDVGSCPFEYTDSICDSCF